MIRVAFAPGEWMSWLGGLHYCRNLLRAVVSDPERELDPVLVLGTRLDHSRLDGFPELPIVRTAIFDRAHPAWAARAAIRRILPRDLLFERLLSAEGARALSHSTQLWPARGIAMLGWIPDFQHRRLPELFSRAERRRRDRLFARICGRSTRVIVSSECCRSDLAAFDPDAAARARVLRFVAEPPPAEALPSPGELLARYEIGSDFFLVANQFWVHKNHTLVLEALRVLRDRGTRALVVATGEAHDWRRPDHFSSLMNRAEELGIADLFRPLGVVPYPDVAALMRDSIAVVNPSRSEGWSTPVEEAKSLGKRVLLSDIDVHREQDPPGGVLFDPDDAEALADAMLRLLNQRDPAADGGLESEARAALPGRRLDFARVYAAIVAEAVGIESRANSG